MGFPHEHPMDHLERFEDLRSASNWIKPLKTTFSISCFHTLFLGVHLSDSSNCNQDLLLPRMILRTHFWTTSLMMQGLRSWEIKLLHLLIFGVHLNLIIARKRIHEGHKSMPSRNFCESVDMTGVRSYLSGKPFLRSVKLMQTLIFSFFFFMITGLVSQWRYFISRLEPTINI